LERGPLTALVTCSVLTACSYWIMSITWSNWRCNISELQPTRWNISWFIYFYRCSTCFRRGSSSHHQEHKLYIQLQVLSNVMVELNELLVNI